MNERLMELAVQTNLGPACESQAIAIKKFAELIVKECAGVCEDYRGTKWGKAAECIGDRIKEHFGVDDEKV